MVAVRFEDFREWATANEHQLREVVGKELGRFLVAIESLRDIIQIHYFHTELI